MLGGRGTAVGAAANRGPGDEQLRLNGPRDARTTGHAGPTRWGGGGTAGEAPRGPARDGDRASKNGPIPLEVACPARIRAVGRGSRRDEPVRPGASPSCNAGSGAMPSLSVRTKPAETGFPETLARTLRRRVRPPPRYNPRRCLPKPLHRPRLSGISR